MTMIQCNAMQWEPSDDKDAGDEENSPQNDFFAESLRSSCSSQLSRLGVCKPEHLLVYSWAVCIGTLCIKIIILSLCFFPIQNSFFRAKT